MKSEAQEVLLDIAQAINWKDQNQLTLEEDKIAKKHWVFIAEELTDPIKRYLALGSLPYIVTKNKEKGEKIGKAILQQIWQDDWPQTEMIGTLIRRPHNPSGNMRAQYMVIGDAPGVGKGAVFNRVERMFTRGPSSHLLRKALISAGLYYEVWFTNLVRNSTEHNRPTLASEVEEYKPYLEKEIEIINPQVIFVLGNHVNEMFDLHYSKVKTQRKVIKLYHPSYVARMNWTPPEYAKTILTRLQQ